MNKKVLIGCVVVAVVVGVIALACVALGGTAILAGLGLTQPAATAGDAFMTALRDGDYDQAYSLCSPGLQKELGSAQDLQELIENGDAQPSQWSFTSRNISGDTGQLDGNVTLTGDRPGTVIIKLVKVGDAWKINGFNLKEK